MTKLRKDFSIWLKIHGSKFFFLAMAVVYEGNDKASAKHLGREWLFI